MVKLKKSRKIKVCVLMGGPSAEHEVSLNTGEMIFQGLNKNKYQAKKIIISKKGQWPISLKELKNNYDLVFNAMHGEYGEDGTIQKILEKAKITFTGSGAKASKLGMDKIASQKVFTKSKIICPPFTISRSLTVIKKLGMPLVVKPVDRGSSVGATIVKKWEDLKEAIEQAEKYSPKVMFQKYISGRELTAGVLEINKKLVALPLVEIKPKTNNFFDYRAKYELGASEEITPAPLSNILTKKAQKIALLAHKVIGCRDYSRTDMILDGNENFYVLEINTLPGMTANSLLPRSAQAAGITFPQLLDIIVSNTLKGI